VKHENMKEIIVFDLNVIFRIVFRKLEEAKLLCAVESGLRAFEENLSKFNSRIF